MKKVFSVLCLPLLQIDNNIYSFMSGIFVSLATNIFTTLCFEQYNLGGQWYYYLSTVMFLTASALCLFLATKLGGVQNYIKNSPRIQPNEKKQILLDATTDKCMRWFLAFFCLFASVILGVLFLAYNFLSNLYVPAV